MLQTMHGGAAARPFRTHMNAFDTELYLRIAPELFLKRAVVGGIERVFEINRNFRNEGADSTHSPEFSMVEAYQAYGDYNRWPDLTQELIQNAAHRRLRLAPRHLADGTEYDLGGEWSAADVRVARAASGNEVTPETRVADLQALAAAVDLACPTRPTASSSKSCGSTSSSVARPPDLRRRLPRRHQPARPGAPLEARRRREVGPLRARIRACHGYSELVDPVIQRERFVEQAPVGAAATTRRCGSTRTSWRRLSTACRRPAGWAWVSTAC